MKPALEASPDALKSVRSALKNAPGRPSNASKALEEARRQGELLVVATLDQFNAAVAKKAEEKLNTPKSRLFADIGGHHMGVKSVGQATGIAEAGLQSNRKRHGSRATRKDEGAATKLKIAEHMKELQKSCANVTEWKSVCIKTYGKTWKTLKNILAGEAEWRSRMKAFKLGFGTTGSTAAKGTCSKGGRQVKKGGIGARRAGGGRKDRFWHFKMQVKAFMERERSQCHHVDKVDLVDEFLDSVKQELELVHERIADLEAKEGNGKKNEPGEEAKKPAEESEEQKELGEENKKPAEEATEQMKGEPKIKKKLSTQSLLQIALAGDCEKSLAAGFEGLRTSAEHVASLSPEELFEWKEELKNRIERLELNEKYKESFATRLLEGIGGKLMQPGRMTTLSMEEEEAGVQATWKQFDVCLWLAAFGEEEDLVRLVANPGEFMENRESAIIGFSDQIPVWVKIGRDKQVYCGNEVKKRKTTEDFTQLQQENKRRKLEDEDKKKTEKTPAEGAEEKEEVEEKTKEPAEEAAEKEEAEEDEEKVEVRIQDLQVEDPNADLGDADMEQEIEKVDEGGKAFKCPLKDI